ncbi:MAG: metal ABC transporter permease [Nitrospirae bacterium]|nr:metal ABC transporter permease [Nitrospirota bacterium]
MEFIIAPLRYEFFLRGLLAAILIGSLCGVIGVFIVLRGMSYIGHGLSHAVFGGAVVSYLMNLNFYIGAGFWGFISALLIKRITKTKKIGADAAIGIITTASFALGVALISRVRRFTRNLEAALFGNILGVTAEDLYVIAAVLTISFIAIFLLYKELLFTTFDKETAEVFGVDTDRVDTFFSLILAAAIIASMQVIGVTLIAAALVIPAITARLLTDSFHKMIILSLLFGMLTAIAGMYASYYLNAASGATIVLVATFLFSIVIGVTEISKTRKKKLV